MQAPCSTYRFFPRLDQLISLLCISLFIFSCSDDDGVGPDAPSSGQDGYFILNEGGFNNGNTSLSYYDRGRDTVLNNVFEAANGRRLGDQSQSMTVIGDRGFIVVQNSAKIEVINRDDFTSVATITEGIVSPRYLIGVGDDKAYVTDWETGAPTGTVKVIDLTTYQVTKTIPVGQGPNGLLLLDGQVYVANNGVFGFDSTVMVLDPLTDVVTDTIVVGGNPHSLAVDVNDNLWVTGSGYKVYDGNSLDESMSTPGFVARLQDDTVAFKSVVDQIAPIDYKAAMDNAGEQFYFLYAGEVYRVGVDDTVLPNAPLIPGNFYGLAIDPVSGEILTGDPMNFASEGLLYRYTPAGELIESYTVGVAPNGFAF